MLDISRGEGVPLPGESWLLGSSSVRVPHSRRTLTAITRPATVGSWRRWSLIHDYARRYSAHDAEGVTDLCVWPFVAIRGGEAIHLADRAAVRDHFAAMMDAYRGQGAAVWSPVEIDSHPLGEHATFETVRWNALDSNGNVLRDTQTTYHLLAAPEKAEGWRFLSYTNHF